MGAFRFRLEVRQLKAAAPALPRVFPMVLVRGGASSAAKRAELFVFRCVEWAHGRAFYA